MRKFILLLCIIILFSFAGCADEEQDTADITPYLNELINMDYAAMFAHTSPVVDIDEEDFVKKYEDIFSGLGVESVTLDSVSEPNDDGEVSCLITYHTKEYGDLSNSFIIKTGLIEGEYMVLWDYGLIFPEMSEGSSVRVSTIHASRGEIFAADGSLLAANSYADTVYMDTEKVQDITAVARAVALITSMTETEIIDLFNEELEKGTQIVVLGKYLKNELTDEQKQALLAVPGLGIDDSLYTPIRDYPTAEYTAHIIGYTGFYTEENLPEGYTTSDRAGLTGLEASYESTLRGTDGKIVYIEDKWGKNVKTIYLDPCEEGQDLRLTIEPKLQKAAFDALSTYLDLEAGETGVAIVLDASTGYVEAMASFPSYDNNLFTFGISQQMWDYYQDAQSKEPLFNRATQGRYPPGSVIKPFTASIALEKNAITPGTIFTGTIIKNKWKPEEEGWVWDPITRVGDSGTPLKLENALVHSDNIFFAYAALRLNEEDFINYLKEIGFEEAVPFDLPVKTANLVSTELYRRRIAEMGYGQGELLIAPIQMASMYTAIANDTGDMLQPILVEKTCQTDGLDYNVTQTFEPTVWKKDAVSDATLDILQPMLKEVVQSGTGYLAKINGVEIAGKTGTAEIGDDKSREISWFVGYWTAGYYPRMVVVMVDTAAEEGAVKFDIAKELLNP